MYFNLDYGVYHPSAFKTNTKLVMKNRNWCIFRHGPESLRLAYVSKFGLIFSYTGVRFPRSALMLVRQEIAPGVWRVAAEIADFMFLQCIATDWNVAAWTVVDRIHASMLPEWVPCLTENTFYGETLNDPKFDATPVVIAPNWQNRTRTEITRDPMRSPDWYLDNLQVG